MKTIDINECYWQLGFKEPPFSITPDTGYFFPGSHHVAALRHLRFGLLSGGFTMLTGEVGLGKTLLCRQLLKSRPNGVRTAFIFNPLPTYEDLLQAIHYDLTGERLPGVSYEQLTRDFYKSLIALAENGERAAVVLDEAHRFSPDLLEGLRLLSNLETEKEKLIYLLLVGQPELEKTIATTEMRPLAQRINIRYRLTPFSRNETIGYIHHRLSLANKNRCFHFSHPAKLLAHYVSGGVPRRINQICDRAIISAFTLGVKRVNAGILWRAAREIV